MPLRLAPRRLRRVCQEPFAVQADLADQGPARGRFLLPARVCRHRAADPASRDRDRACRRRPARVDQLTAMAWDTPRVPGHGFLTAVLLSFFASGLGLGPHTPTSFVCDIEKFLLHYHIDARHALCSRANGPVLHANM